MSGTVECKHGEEMTALMSLALDRLLGAGDRERLKKHMDTCASCRVEWGAMRQVAALFEQSPMVGPPLGFAIRVERQLGEKSKNQRQFFGGLALLTSSLSLAGVTIAVVALIVAGIVAWQWFEGAPTFQQGTNTVSLVASSVGLMGKGASLFLGDLLMRYGPPLVVLLGIGLLVLIGVWVWLFVKRPGGSHHNGYA